MENVTIKVSGGASNGKKFATTYPAVKPASLAELMKVYPKVATDEKEVVEGYFQRTLVIFSQNAGRNAGVAALEEGKSVEEANKLASEAAIDYLKNGPSATGGVGRGPDVVNVLKFVLADAKANTKTSAASVAAAKAFQASFFTDPDGASSALRAQYNAIKASQAPVAPAGTQPAPATK